ncbi:MAG: hypothetical protein NTU63_00860 [Candidatus Pacearchaeota archaeon]|nr:hypothetical protein [Candidatus Pacearchaeota archaeon]
MNKKIKTVFLLIGILIMIIVASILISAFTIKNSSSFDVKINRTWTKAICDSENFCQDYEISCKDENLVKMVPITGAAVKFSLEWKDPRDEEARKELC